MVLDIVDDLSTPGCANCAVKHLSAALTYLVMSAGNDLPTSPGTEIVARACVNLVEAAEGYASHLPFAIGLLAMAEEAMVAREEVGAALTVRGIRTSLISGGMHAVSGSLDSLSVLVDDLDMARGHFEEAKRELPGWDWKSCPLEVNRLVAAIDGIRGEYFEFDEPEGKGGE